MGALTKRADESHTAFAIRCIRADAWDAGYTSGFYDRDFMNTAEARDASEGRSENPYATPTDQPEEVRCGGEEV